MLTSNIISITGNPLRVLMETSVRQGRRRSLLPLRLKGTTLEGQETEQVELGSQGHYYRREWWSAVNLSVASYLSVARYLQRAWATRSV